MHSSVLHLSGGRQNLCLQKRRAHACGKEEKNLLDMKFVRENPEIVKENIRKKFQDSKLPLVDEVIALDEQSRAAKSEADGLRAARNQLSK